MNKTEILPGIKQKRTPVLGEEKADREACRQGRLFRALGKVGLPELVRVGRRCCRASYGASAGKAPRLRDRGAKAGK